MPVRNGGAGAAADLVATVSLPTGMAVRAGGGGSPADWGCTGSGQVATCEVARLPAGRSGIFRIMISVAQDATPGAVAGEVTCADGSGAAIPSAVMQVEAQ